MRHNKHHASLGVTREHRKAMLSNMGASLIQHGRIETTLVKAKALRPLIQKVITKAKNAAAAPVKAAMVRAKLGKEADTSAQAKAFIEKNEEDYVLAMIMPPMPGMGGAAPAGPGGGERKGPPGGGPDAEKRVVEATTLSWKGHEGVHPSKVIMPKENAPYFIFHFAKTHPIELEDKEVEFASKRGNMEIKKKFKLKDMVYQGKLAL